MLPKIEPMTASTSGATATTANPVPLRQDARTIGTTLQVRGTFNLACPDHDGASDLHAQVVTVIQQAAGVLQVRSIFWLFWHPCG